MRCRTNASINRVPGAQGPASDTSKQSPSTASSRQPQEDQQLEKLVTDEPIVRSTTPMPKEPDRSGPPSPSGSPPLTAQASLPHLASARSRAPEAGRSPEAERARVALPQKPMAHRSKSVSSSGVVRSTTWTETGSSVSKLPAPRMRGGTRSGSSAIDESPRSRPKGIVAFLKSGRNRGKSPASTKKYPEGVMGKEGARMWVKE